MAFFCPVCFGQSESSSGQCLQCGTDLVLWTQTHSYTERLMQALQHPIAEVRMGAIIALGMRCDIKAAGALVDCAIAHPADIPEGLEIVNTLAHLAGSTTGIASLQKLAANHPAQPVRAAAQKVLKYLSV